MGKRKRQSDIEDDGRVIAPMNVEGMPWYAKKPENTEESGEPYTMTPAEKRAFTWGVVKAALLVAAVFIGVYLCFILFCTEIWFK